MNNFEDITLSKRSYLFISIIRTNVTKHFLNERNLSIFRTNQTYPFFEQIKPNRFFEQTTYFEFEELDVGDG